MPVPPTLRKPNPNHTAEQAAARKLKRERQIADKKAKGKYIPTREEVLYEAMIPAFKAGMTIDEVRSLIFASRIVHSQGTSFMNTDLETMMVELSSQNLMYHDIIEKAAKEK